MSITEIRPADLPASPPGRTLRRLLEQEGMSQAELARRMKRPYQVVNDIVNARRPITAPTALGTRKPRRAECSSFRPARSPSMRPAGP